MENRGGADVRTLSKGPDSAASESPAPERRPRSPWYVQLLRGLAVLVALGALGIFAYWAYRFTLRPVKVPKGWNVGNTHPGNTIRFYLEKTSPKEAALEIGGNIALLAPLGVLLPLIFTRLRGLIRITLLAALISLAIETVQGTFIAGRAFDVDDIILNTFGVALAYLLFGRRISRFVRGRRRKA
jgi:glycopeptide antibiotics resistance protein